jgi:hypothetical protein
LSLINVSKNVGPGNGEIWVLYAMRQGKFRNSKEKIEKVDNENACDLVLPLVLLASSGTEALVC